MKKSKTQKIIAVITSVCFGLTPTVTIAAGAENRSVNQDAVKGFITASRDINTLESRLKSIEKSNIVQQEMMKALTKMLKESGQLKGLTSGQKDKVTQSISNKVSGKTKKLMNDIAKNIHIGDWTDGLQDSDVLKNLKALTKQSQELKKMIEKQRESINKSIEHVCQGENPRAWPPLAQAGLSEIPEHWSTQLATNVRTLGVKLPNCFDKPSSNSSGTVGDDVERFQKTLETGQELQFAISNMMMMAMSTGNPYIIAAAMVLMAIMAIFSDDGGDGGETGNGQSKSEKDSVSEGNGNSDNNSNQQGEKSKPEKNTGNSENGGSSQGITTPKSGSIEVTRKDNALWFVDTKKGGKPFVLKWSRIKDTNGDLLPPMPDNLTVKEASVQKGIVILENFKLDGQLVELTISRQESHPGWFIAKASVF